jgi:hypothetical protein
MITKNAWENWRFRIRGAVFLSFCAAAFAVFLAAGSYDRQTNGWYFHWLNSSILVETGVAGFSGGRAVNGQLHADFLEGFCRRNQGACPEFSRKARFHFRTLPLAAGSGTFVGLMGILFFFSRRGKKKDEEHRRGARSVEVKQLRRQLRKEKSAGDIELGGVPWPRDDEARGLLLAGSPGSGKSAAIHSILKVLRARGDRVIIVDAGGQFVEKWARSGDVLLNSFDARGVKWSPFAEGHEPWEIEALARSFYPSAEGTNGFFSDLAMQVFAGLLEQCRTHGIPNNHALAALAGGDVETIVAMLAGHPAQAVMSSGSPSTIGSILTNLNTGARGLRYLHPEAGADDFSITRWVKEGNGWMFISYELAQRAALSTILSAQLDLVARGVLGLQPDRNRRIWLIVDELPLLGKVESVTEFLTNGRKYGGCGILGIQVYPQLEEKYGREGAKVLLGCLPSQLILRTPDPETADLMSKLIGEREISRHTESEGRTEHGVSKNRQEQVTNSRVVMSSEIQKLPDMAGYLNLIGDRPVAKIKLTYPDLRDSGNPPFKPRQLPARQPFTLPPSVTNGQPAASITEPPKKPKGEAPAPKPEPAPAIKPVAQDDDWLAAAKE